MSDTPDRTDESDEDAVTGLESGSDLETGSDLESASDLENGARGEEDLPAPPHEKLIWVLAWGMGIIGAIVIIVWAGMILFVN